MNNAGWPVLFPLFPSHSPSLYYQRKDLQKDLIYREPLPTSALEHDLEVIDNDGDVDWVDEDECKSLQELPLSWDTLLINVEDSDDLSR